MTKKQEFIEFIEGLLENQEVPENVQIYFDALKAADMKTEKSDFTPNGKAILQYLQKTPVGMYKSRDIAEGMFIAPKSVSGAMRKLVTDGYVEKIGKDPIVYTITEKGKNVVFEEGEN